MASYSAVWQAGRRRLTAAPTHTVFSARHPSLFALDVRTLESCGYGKGGGTPVAQQPAKVWPQALHKPWAFLDVPRIRSGSRALNQVLPAYERMICWLDG
ncbi:hypothetical protein RvY_14039 [Ramazzottius varieornatus]|uniref:Uncharacterized protein n=1 Tax=Ramazzottius varieornatus TaxID=947166 RepID=A0A1D1VXA7_RAMVA|nr:hypothetical protein RvY_14039 [Ramazzottius varieornatus]